MFFNPMRFCMRILLQVMTSVRKMVSTEAGLMPLARSTISVGAAVSS